MEISFPCDPHPLSLNSLSLTFCFFVLLVYEETKSEPMNNKHYHVPIDHEPTFACYVTFFFKNQKLRDQEIIIIDTKTGI